GRDDLLPQPGRRACVSRDLLGGLPERAPGAGRLEAEPAPLGPHHLYRPSNRDVPNLLVPAGVDLRRDQPAGRTAWRGGRGDHHPPVPIGQVDDVDDLVIGQVEDRARSIALRTSILMHRLVVLWDVDVLTTPITAGPRAVLRQRRDAPHHHEPRRAWLLRA